MNDTEIRTELADSDNVVRYVKPKSVLSNGMPSGDAFRLRPQEVGLSGATTYRWRWASSRSERVADQVLLSMRRSLSLQIVRAATLGTHITVTWR